MIKVPNLDGLRRHFSDWLGDRAVEATMVYRGLAAEIFTYMVHETPQYSGESVSNWRLSAGAPIFSEHSGHKAAFKSRAKEPFNKPSGDGAGPNWNAMDEAIEGLRKALHGVTLSKPVFITNATAFDRTGYVSEIIERQPTWLREVNAQSMAPVGAAQYVREKYSGVLDVLKIRMLMQSAT